MIEDMFTDYMENNNVEDGTAVRRSYKRVLSYLAAILPVDKKNVDDMLTMLGYEYEKQGFVNGFTYALSIVQESNLGRCKA